MKAKTKLSRWQRYYDRNREYYQQWRANHPGFVTQYQRLKEVERASQQEKQEADIQLAMEQLGLTK